MRMSDWSPDVCSSDLLHCAPCFRFFPRRSAQEAFTQTLFARLGRLGLLSGLGSLACIAGAATAATARPAAAALAALCSPAPTAGPQQKHFDLAGHYTPDRKSTRQNSS